MELTVEVDDPTATLVVGGHRLGDGQVLNDAALPRIEIELQRGIAKIALVVHAQLLVVDAFAGVVGFSHCRGGARVVLVSAPGLPQRVLRVVLLKAAVDQCQA
ncbi:hypothetical protein D3C80_1685480 [compost metagenome]